MTSEKAFFVYIISSRPGGPLYIGVTSHLLKRIWEHREGIIKGFTQRYEMKKLVYFEPHGNAESAIQREKQMKKWNRAWKVELIERDNPYWIDLFPSLRP